MGELVAEKHVQVIISFEKLDIASLENEDGSFSGHVWGEVDTGSSYVALCCLSLLRRLEKINVDKAVNYIVSCKNVDGGFGCTPGGESHSWQSCLHHVDRDLLGRWLCECQVKSGGLDGRPEKLPDDKENGGISDRPKDAVDIFHTYFGVAGLSLLEYPGIKTIDPAYALPVDVINRIFSGK